MSPVYVAHTIQTTYHDKQNIEHGVVKPFFNALKEVSLLLHQQLNFAVCTQAKLPGHTSKFYGLHCYSIKR